MHGNTKITSTENWASSVNRLSERSGSCGCGLRKIVHIWCDVPVQGGVLCEGNTDIKHLCTKFSLHMSVLHQSCNFCIYLYLGFVVLLREHYLRAVFFLSSSFARWNKQVFLKIPCNFSYFAMWNSAMCLMLLLFQLSSSTISTAETVYEVYVGRFFICKSIGILTIPKCCNSPTVQATSQDIQNSKSQQCYSLH